MLLQDDRQKYVTGKLVGAAQQFAQTMKRSKGAGKEIVESDILERGVITPKEALSMLDDKVSPQEVKKVLEASGYSSKETNELVRKWMEEQTIKGLSPKEVEALLQKRKVYQEEKSLQKQRQKELKPMTKAEEEEALDKLMEEFSKGGRVQANQGFPKENSFDEMSKNEQAINLVGLRQAVLQPERGDADEIKAQFQENFGTDIYLRERNKILKEYENERDKKAEGGNVDEQMSMLMGPQQDTMMEEEMESDSEMEDNYLDFIINEALTPEEEEMLMSKLEQDEELAMVFDKVIGVAQEFAGSGPVEGPGTGVSDSIPARLSDGEFVFTAKAVEEIGADNLMAMMKDAEMKADDRQGLAEGGEPEEDTVEMEVEKPATKQDIRVVKTTVDNGGKGLLDEDEISKSIKSKMMLDNRTGRHVQS